MSAGNNLIALALKATDPLPSLADDLLAYLARSSDTTHPHALQPDALAWQHLRERALGTTSHTAPLVHKDSLPLLTEYYAQLSFILTKLPADTPLPFPWYPLYAPAFPHQPPLAPASLEYERAAVLYNLAALHAQLATRHTRSDQHAIKAAIAHYQHAAGTLALLVALLPRLDASLHGSPAPADLAHPTLTALHDLCLAQAQEVAWQKAVMDRLKNGTVAKVAMRVAELYASARHAAERARAGSDTAQPLAFPEEITRYLAIKTAHFTAVAHYRRSLDDLGANRYGDELGRLQLADEKLREAGAVGKRGVPDAVMQDFKSLHKTVAENLARATKDNDLIYLSTPTPPSSLSPISSAPLARPTLAPELADPLAHLREPLFRALVPREVREVLDLWEDRKEGWLEGRVVGPAGELDAAAEALLNELNLPASLESASSSSQAQGVPPAVLDASARVQAEGGTERAETMIQDVRRVAGVNARMLKEATDALDRESASDASHSSGHGPSRWTRPPSAVAAAPLRDRAAQLGGALAAAGDSDALVRDKFAKVREEVKVLQAGGDALRREVPASDTPAPSPQGASTEAEAARRKLRALLDTLADVRAARARVVAGARTSVAQGDIRDVVLREAERRAARGGQGGEEEEGLAGYEELLCREGDRLLRVWEDEVGVGRARQEDLLGEIRAQHAALLASTTASRAAPSAAQEARTRATQRLCAAAVKYAGLLQNLHEGLRFYAGLGKLVGELRDACKSFEYARTAEAQDLARALAAPPPAPAPPPAARSPAPPPAAAPSTPAPTPASAPAPAPEHAPAPQAAEPAQGTPRRRAPPPAAATATAVNVTGGTTPRRSARRAAVPAPAAEEDGEAGPEPEPVKPRREREKERSREREKEKEKKPVGGGWDPSLGIQFG